MPVALLNEAWGAGTRRASGRAAEQMPPLARAQRWRRQAVLERPVAEVAAPVVRELRLALLAPAELSALEEQNRREPLIPVRTRGTGLRSTPGRGGSAGGAGLGLQGEVGPAGHRGDPVSLQVEQIVEAWKCHALRRGDAARGALCRRRRGTLPREHHRFLDPPFK